MIFLDCFPNDLKLVVLCISCVFIAVIASMFYLKKSIKEKRIPGPPKTHPRRGNLDELTAAGGVHQYAKQILAKYGKIAGFWFGENYIVSVSCPYLWKDILPLFDRPYTLFKAFEPISGKNSYVWKNGKAGRQFRQLVDRNFTHEAVQNYYVYFLEAVNKKAQQWMSLPKGEHFPVADSMFIIAIESIDRAGMGKSFKDENDVKMFSDAYKVAWRELDDQRDPAEPGSEREKKFNEAVKYMRMFARNLIKERRVNPDYDEKKLIIDSLIQYKDIDHDECQLVDDIVSFIIGGFHTTAMMMIWCIYYLAMHQDVQEKVYQELLDVLGDEEIQPSDAAELQYCRQVLDETLRCAIVTPWGARVSDRDVKVGEYIVPKETPILTPFGVVLHDPEIFPEPERFDPDRFSPENSKDRPPLAFQPFGFAGKRKCPAWRFALSEGVVFLSVFYRKFKIKLVDGEKVELKHQFVTSPKEEFYVTIEKR